MSAPISVKSAQSDSVALEQALAQRLSAALLPGDAAFSAEGLAAAVTRFCAPR